METRSVTLEALYKAYLCQTMRQNKGPSEKP